MDGTMKPGEALSVANEIKKMLVSLGVWYKYSEEVQGELKFIRLEASIKVKA